MARGSPKDRRPHGRQARATEELLAAAKPLHLAGDLRQSEAIYRRVLEGEPDHALTLCLLGDIAGRTGRHDEAVALIGRALEKEPGRAPFHAALGHEYRLQRKWQQAEAAYREAARLAPAVAEHLNNLGVVVAEQNRAADAESLFREALRADPGYVPAHSNLGTALHKQGRLTEAEDACRAALRAHPDWVEAHGNLGVTLVDLGRPDEAIFHLQRALDMRPEFAHAHYNLGNAYREQGRINEVCRSLETALALEPGYTEARWNLALMELLRGDWVRGWDSYESRWQRPEELWPSAPRWRKMDKPRWDGADPAGRTILLQSEQGTGDTVHFIRYAPLLARRGARVLVESPPELKRLLAAMPGISGVVDVDGELPDFDAACPLLSLPRLFGTTVADVPAEIPYLAAHPRLVEHWRKRVAEGSAAFRVGIVWAGNPRHKDDRKRSMALEAFAPLARIEGVAWHSLQKGAAAAQVAQPPAGMPITDLAREVRDFADTAALLMSLDLVIAVDTAVVHLAGALGRPVWTLLPFVPDWRWLLERDDTPWYPTMRLFRQQRPGDWGGVMEAVAVALRQETVRFRDSAATAGAGAAARNPGGGQPVAASAPDVDRELAEALGHFRGGRTDEAEALCDQALRTAPGNSYALHLAGAIAHARGDHAAARGRLEAALGLRGEVAMFHNTLGNVLRAQGQLDEAAASYRRAVRLRSGYAEAHNNLGNALRAQGLIEQAMIHYREAVRCDPGSVEIRWNAARGFLLGGDFERGWREYQSRWRQQRFLARHRPLREPRWGGEEIGGRRILLASEQGAGDTLQFVRYAPLVAARGARVIVECQPELKRLLAGTEGISAVYARGETLPPFDCWCPLLSLPLAFATTLDSVPARTPYLRVPPELVAGWRERIAPLRDAFKVGLVWAGAAGHGNDPERSLPLAALAPLARSSGAAFVSLQKGAPAGQSGDPDSGIRVADYGEELHDFADTAALILNLDLVITVDTAVAHLAGALARPAWVLLPYAPDWRWLAGRADTPWYPGMRLLRQVRRGEWMEPIARAARLLAVLAAGSAPSGRIPRILQ